MRAEPLVLKGCEAKRSDKVALSRRRHGGRLQESKDTLAWVERTEEWTSLWHGPR